MSKEFDEFMESVKALPDYPELEGIMNLCEDIIEKKTGKMTEKEWQAAERSQTSTMKAMTSIEWLIEELTPSIALQQKYIDELKDKAKEMHKQEIIDAFDEGQEYEYQYHINNAPNFYSETYYQETFKKN